MSGDSLELSGVVVERRADVLVVDVRAGALRRRVLAKVGRRRRFVAGERVTVAFDLHDLTRGRITEMR